MSLMYIEEIEALLPHRYPFLMIDRILALVPGKTIMAIKNITANEPQFSGHFPQEPIMPGVLMIEAMAQAAGILVFQNDDIQVAGGSAYYLTGVDKARFKRPVIPGDQLRIDVEFLKSRLGIYVFDGKCHVEDQLTVSAELMCTVKQP